MLLNNGPNPKSSADSNLDVSILPLSGKVKVHCEQKRVGVWEEEKGGGG
jgi:hypothetical protein